MNSLLSALLSLVIGATALYYALPMLVDAQMQPAQNDAGNQIAILEAATASYILGNASTPTLKGIAPGTPLIMTPSSFPTQYPHPTGKAVRLKITGPFNHKDLSCRPPTV